MVGLGSHSCLQWRGLSLRRPSAAGSFGSRYADTAAHRSRPVLHRRGVSSHTESNPSVVLWHISTSTNFAALHRDQLCKESGARRQARTRTRRNATRTRRNAALHMAQRITSHHRCCDRRRDRSVQYLSHLLHGLRTRSDSLECGRQDMKLLWLELRATVVGEQTIASAAAQVLVSPQP
jgi:hypothetical protein